MKRKTPAARAIVGCLALATDDTISLNAAVKLAGYDIKTATPVRFYRGQSYRNNDGVYAGSRVVVRSGRIVKVSHSARDLTAWMLRMGRKLSALPGLQP